MANYLRQSALDVRATLSYSNEKGMVLNSVFANIENLGSSHPSWIKAKRYLRTYGFNPKAILNLEQSSDHGLNAEDMSVLMFFYNQEIESRLSDSVTLRHNLEVFNEELRLTELCEKAKSNGDSASRDLAQLAIFNALQAGIITQEKADELAKIYRDTFS